MLTSSAKKTLRCVDLVVSGEALPGTFAPLLSVKTREAAMVRFGQKRFFQKAGRQIASTASRVKRHTPHEVNWWIYKAPENRLSGYEAHPDESAARLQRLDQEWDVERARDQRVHAGLTGVMLSATVDRRWLALLAVVTAFLFQHAVQGCCPPLPILRRLGFRTAEEIGQEGCALKAFAAFSGKLSTILRAIGLRKFLPVETR